MNNKLLTLALCGLFFSFSGGAQNLRHLQPKHQVFKPHQVLGSHNIPLRGTISCGVDTVYYTTAKTTQTEIKILFSNGTFTNAASQFFPASSSFPITIDGFKWFGYSVDPNGSSNPSIDVTCSVYTADSDSLPTGSPLASTTVTVDSTRANAERDAVFPSPVTVTGNYVIVLSTTATDHLYIYSNDEDLADGQGERLSGTFYEPANEWRKNDDLWALGDFDYLFSPFVTFDITADFVLPVGCTGAPTIFDNTSAGYWNNRFYNFDRYQGNPRDFDWDYGDANTDNNLLDGQNTYASAGTYSVSLDATFNGWTTICTEVVTQSLDVNDPPPAPSATAPAPVCEYTTPATLTASGTGGDFTWYSDSISGQLGTGSPWNSGIVTIDTVWVTETLLGCEGPATELPVDFIPNPLPTFTVNGLGGLQVEFLGAPASAVSYAWDFDDGNTSTVQEPTHTFASAGPWDVCVTVDYSNGCQNEYCELVNFTSINEVEPFTVSVYPNPVHNVLHVSVDKNASLMLYDQSGRLVLRETALVGVSRIDLSALSSGTYLLILKNEHGVVRRRIIK